MERPSIDRPSGLQRLHLLDEHLLGIGYVAVRAGQLDARIEEIVARTAPYFAATIGKLITDLSTPKKIDLVGEWLTTDLPGDKTKIREFISAVHAVRNERDHVIHRLYVKTDKDDVKKLYDPRKKGDDKFVREVTAQSMVDLGERIMRQTEQLDGWTSKALEALLAERPPWLDTLGQPLPPPKNFSAMSRARLRESKILAATQSHRPEP